MVKESGRLLTIPRSWKEYELIDCGDHEKLERFGNLILIRPEPGAYWKKILPEDDWKRMHHARFVSETATKGQWIRKKNFPAEWNIVFHDKFSLQLTLTAFKHIGVFPEQAANWDYIGRTLKSFTSTDPQVLNLFAYTGAASLMARASGAETTHVDSIRQVVTWANRNQELSGLKDIRWIVEDAFKFVKKQLKRGKRYHGIIMDPPAYGHGPKGEKWKLENQIEELVGNALQLLEPSEHFFILNTYTPGFLAENIQTLIQQKMPAVRHLETGQLYLEATSGKKLPVSSFGRFYKTKATQ